MKYTIKYFLSEDPFFHFDSFVVPAEHSLCYSRGSKIFEYLNLHLTPMDIEKVRIVSDGGSSSVVIFYLVDDCRLLEMPWFEECSD